MNRSLLVSFAAMVVVASALTAHMVIAQPRNFSARLSGANEVPPGDTKARGEINLQLNADGTELSFRLIVANIENVRFSHIHMAPEGVNGPIVVTLYPGPKKEGRFSGVLAAGTITAADLEGPLAGESLGTLIDRLENGQLYVNVHTDQIPPGEIRGQLR